MINLASGISPIKWSMTTTCCSTDCGTANCTGYTDGWSTFAPLPFEFAFISWQYTTLLTTADAVFVTTPSMTSGLATQAPPG